MVERFSFPVDRYVPVGRVSKAHGVRGELKVMPLSGHPEQFKQYSRVALAAADGRMTAPLAVVECRSRKNHVILKLATIDTKNEADLTAGMDVLLPREEYSGAGPPDRADELRGRAVRLIDGNEAIGTIVDLFHNGAQEVLLVSDGAHEYMIPNVARFVIGLSGEELLIDPPPGLLDITSGTDGHGDEER